MKSRLHLVSVSRSAALLGALLSSCASPAFAATHGQWATIKNGGWGSADNWVGGVIADGADAVATFGTPITGTTQVGVDAGRTVGHLVFSSKEQWQLTGQKLTLAVRSADESPTIMVNDGYQFISCGLAGTQGFVKRGGARLFLMGDNTYTGSTYIAVGLVYTGGPSSLGAIGPGNDTVIDAQTGQLHLRKSVRLDEDLVLFRSRPGDSNNLYNDGGDCVLGGTLTFQRGGSTDRPHISGVHVTGGTLIQEGRVMGKLTPGATPGVAGADSNILRFRVAPKARMDILAPVSDGDIGAGGLTLSKTDPGVLRLSAANTYSGSTIHDGGLLLVNNSRGSGTGGGAVAVGAQAVLGGSGILAPTARNGITFAAGATVAPGAAREDGSGVAAADRLTFHLGETTGRVNFQTGAIIAFDLNGASPRVSEGLVFSGLRDAQPRVFFNDNVVNFTVSGGAVAPGVYPLMTFDAPDAYSGRLVLGTGLEAYSATLIYHADSIQLKLARK